MATMPWIKLDWNWAESPEAELLRKRHGSKALLKWIQLMILMAEFEGALNLKNEMQMHQATIRMRCSEAKVWELVEWCAECGLINADILRAHGYATSARALRDARAREGRREYAKARANVVNNCGNACSKPGSGSGKHSGMASIQSLVPGAIGNP